MRIKQDIQQIKRLFKRCFLFFFVLLLTIVFGAVGYRLIEGWPFYDGIYMAVITIASIGYREIGDLSPAGRFFTEILIFMGVTVIASWVAVVTSFLIDSDLKNYFRRRAMIDKISKMRGHTIVCGGRYGYCHYS